jgi:hypothetical protein
MIYLLYTLNISWLKYAILLINMGVFTYFLAVRSIAFGIHKTLESLAQLDVQKQEQEDKNRYN